MTTTDRELVGQVLSGRLDALTPLLARYEAGALRYACSIVRDPDDGEDVVQQAFIKAYRNLRAYDAARPFQPWLLRIVRNEALNWIRKHRRMVYGESAQITLELVASDQDIHGDVERSETRSLVQQCLFDLPLKYREVLELYYIEERSYQEISDILRVPMGTVGTNIRRGKEQLKILIEREGGA